jgi:glycyl-tRNA synthetase (class II)
MSLKKVTDKAIIENHLQTGKFILEVKKHKKNRNYDVNGQKIKKKIIEIYKNVFINDTNNINEIETSIINPNKKEVVYAIDKYNKYHDLFLLIKKHNPELHNVANWSLEKLDSYVKQYKLIDFNESEIKKNPTKLVVEIKNKDNDMISLQMMYATKNKNHKFPFGIAQIGNVFNKNEYTQLSIEYFFDPLKTKHKHFSAISAIKICIIDKTNYLITIDEALEKKIIDNEIMAFYIAKSWISAIQIGIDEKKIKFKRKSSFTWQLQCIVGGNELLCATITSQESSLNEVKRKTLSSKLISQLDIKGLKQYLKTTSITDELKEIIKLLLIMTPEELIKKYNFPSNLIKIKKVNKYDSFLPQMVKTSINIDNLFTAIFWHNLYFREENPRKLVLSLNNIYPYRYAIFQLHKKIDGSKIREKIIKLLMEKGETLNQIYFDDSMVSIGKKYVRADEIGVRYCLTIDSQTIKDETITLRARDTTKQLRMHLNKL